MLDKTLPQHHSVTSTTYHSDYEISNSEETTLAPTAKPEQLKQLMFCSSLFYLSAFFMLAYAAWQLA